VSNNQESKLQLVGDAFERQNYAFALPVGSPYMKRINRTLTQLRESGFIEEVDKKWFAPPTP
jgi:ABC-type amino acid transport substrate-binding protein